MLYQPLESSVCALPVSQHKNLAPRCPILSRNERGALQGKLSGFIHEQKPPLRATNTSTTLLFLNTRVLVLHWRNIPRTQNGIQSYFQPGLTPGICRA